MLLQLQLLAVQASSQHLKARMSPQDLLQLVPTPSQVYLTNSSFCYHNFASILCERLSWSYHDSTFDSAYLELHHKVAYTNLIMQVTMLFSLPLHLQEWATRGVFLAQQINICLFINSLLLSAPCVHSLSKQFLSCTKRKMLARDCMSCLN